MAEACKELPVEQSSNPKVNQYECAVCLQNCVHPVQLPCGHIFCFLCVKGIAHQSKKCAMCRQDIPHNFIEQPNLLQRSVQCDEGFDGGYQWFYEGRNGWWQYDPRTNEDIEHAFKSNVTNLEILICGEIYVIDLNNNCQYCKKNPNRKRSIKRDKICWWQCDERTSKELESCYKEGERICELLIAGFLYTIDLENMIQLRRNDPARRRKIKRDLATIPKKGIAGLRNDGVGECISGNIGTSEITATLQNSTGENERSTLHENHELHTAMERFNSLNLADIDNDNSNQHQND